MPRSTKAKDTINNMKLEIAEEKGIKLGPDTTSRLNGSVGGEMVKRFVALAQEQLSSGYPKTNINVK